MYPQIHENIGWLSTSEEIKLSTLIHMEDHQKSNMFYHFLKETSRWIHNAECLQSPWSKVCGMWYIYIIHQLNKGLDLITAIHQELYGTGDDLYQNDRYIEMWFSYNYARVIISQNGMRRMTPPDFLFKHRILNL